MTWVRKRILDAVIVTVLLIALPYAADSSWWWWPPWPGPVNVRERFGAFALWSWINWLGHLAALLFAIAMALLRRRAIRLAGPALMLFVSVITVVAYGPLAYMTERRTDRIRGAFEEPVHASRALAVAVALTLGLALLFVLVTRLRRTPETTRTVAHLTLAALPALLLPLFWLFAVIPASNRWFPNEWKREDLLVPFRPCRHALVWASPRGTRGVSYPLARVDGIWSRFRDPLGGQVVPAVSLELTWMEGYSWLTLAEEKGLSVRKDDPAVLRCDARPRPEVVEPAAWHQRGPVRP